MIDPVKRKMTQASQDKASGAKFKQESGPKPAAKRRGPRPPKKVTETWLHNSGLAYLQRFPSGSAHFRRIMTRKIDRSCKHHADQDRAACLEMLESLIDKFRDIGLLNDEAYLKSLVSSLRRRGQSETAIRAKLQMKSIRASETETAVRAHDDENGVSDQDTAVIFARRKKIGPFRKSGEYQKEKELAAFARAGYSYETAQRVMDMDPAEAEEILTRLL